MTDQSDTSKEVLRIPVKEVHDTLNAILLNIGFSGEKASACAAIFLQNTCEGSVSHGISRFPRFVEYVNNRHIDVLAEPELKKTFGTIEQWDGHRGPGPLNALFCTRRAMEISSEHGIGCVGLANTNHWMRGGYYARVSAAEGYIFIGWTNTIANMPAWGAKDRRLGNNPLVIGIPFEPSPLVLDMAMSQFSYGSMEIKAMRGERLSVPGGYTQDGILTDDPSAILASGRPLQAGYWKGSGLAMFLDILAAVLSGGSSTREISSRTIESALSQVFIAIPVSLLNTDNTIAEMIRSIVDDVHRSIPIDENNAVRYPGEHAARLRHESEKLGVPVDPSIWYDIQRLLSQ